MKRTSLIKYIITGFISGFLLCLAGMTFEEYNHNIPIIQAISHFHHFIFPVFVGIVFGYLGYFYWSRNTFRIAENEDYTKNLHALLDVNSSLISTIDLDSILQIIIDESTHLTNLDTGAIYLHENEKLFLGATTPPLPEGFPEGLRYDLLRNHPNIQKSLFLQQPVTIPDTKIAKLSEAEKAVVDFRGLRSIIYIPLIIDKRPVGTLILGTTNSLRNFSEHEINVYQSFSGQAALCIENANLYKKSIQISDELRQQNEEFLSLNEELSESYRRIQKINDDLNIAKEKAEESDRMKTVFLQNISHEIRTPMNVIMGFSGLLPESFYDKKKLEYFSGIINQRSGDLLDIVNDLLDITIIETGHLPLNIGECNVKVVFEELTSIFIESQKYLNKRHIRINLHADCDSPDMILLTDIAKFKQIFINLISNALKFTDHGKIEGGCRYNENHKLVFYVSDTGQGIPLEKQKIIFDRFVQLENNPAQNLGGTGLGLSIVKGLVHALGGELFLSSEPGKGSTFSFTIPYELHTTIQDNSHDVDSKRVYDFAGKSILVVEDDTFNTQYIKEVLSKTGLKIHYAITGNEAIKMTQINSFDLILMDIRLPDISGYVAISQIKQIKPEIKIIAQTAYATLDDRQKCIEAGCIDFISKPIKKEALLAMIHNHL